MNILKPVQAYLPFREMGGPIVKVQALASTLTRHGHNVSVVTADLGLATRRDIGMRIEPMQLGVEGGMRRGGDHLSRNGGPLSSAHP